MAKNRQWTPRIVMLDFDGVLNMEGSKRYDRYNDYAIEYELAQRVRHLVEQLNAHVVISSNWRYSCDFPELRQIVERFGMFGDRVIGQTPFRETRGEEIQAWLEEFAEPVRLVVLDDNDQGEFNMDGVRQWFIKTDPKVGVTEADIVAAGALLIAGPVWSGAYVSRG